KILQRAIDVRHPAKIARVHPGALRREIQILLHAVDDILLIAAVLPWVRLPIPWLRLNKRSQCENSCQCKFDRFHVSFLCPLLVQTHRHSTPPFVRWTYALPLKASRLQATGEWLFSTEALINSNRCPGSSSSR